MVSLLDLLELVGDVLGMIPERWVYQRNDDDAAPRRKRNARVEDEGARERHLLFRRSKSGPTDND